jgi:acetyl esterase/lipase
MGWIQSFLDSWSGNVNLESHDYSRVVREFRNVDYGYGPSENGVNIYVPIVSMRHSPEAARKASPEVKRSREEMKDMRKSMRWQSKQEVDDIPVAQCDEGALPDVSLSQENKEDNVSTFRFSNVTFSCIEEGESTPLPTGDLAIDTVVVGSSNVHVMRVSETIQVPLSTMLPLTIVAGESSKPILKIHTPSYDIVAEFPPVFPGALESFWEFLGSLTTCTHAATLQDAIEALLSDEEDDEEDEEDEDDDEDEEDDFVSAVDEKEQLPSAEEVETETPPASSKPILIFVYAGSWPKKSKYHYWNSPANFGRAFALGGFVTITLGIRLSPATSSYPVAQHKIAGLLSWLQENAEKFGGNSRGIFLCGHGPSAHMGALTLLDATFFAEEELDWSACAGFIGISGIYNMTRLHHSGWLAPSLRHYSTFGTNPLTLQEVSPTAHIRSNMPPFLLLNTPGDWYLPQDTLQMSEHLRSVGTHVTVKELDHDTYLSSVGFSSSCKGQPSQKMVYLVHDWIMRRLALMPTSG